MGARSDAVDARDREWMVRDGELMARDRELTRTSSVSLRIQFILKRTCVLIGAPSRELTAPHLIAELHHAGDVLHHGPDA